jgi:hypothetical protein
MGLAEFENRIRTIEANHPDFFKGKKRIFSFFAFDPVRNTDKYVMTIYDNMDLPQNIRRDIQDAFDKFLK